MNTWSAIPNTGHPDQQLDPGGRYWAQCGPESDGRWSWVVLDNDNDNAEIANGIEASESLAKAAAAEAIPTPERGAT